MVRLPALKKLTLEDRFYHARFREPYRFSIIRTPDWAARVAGSEVRGGEVRVGPLKDTGRWKVQSVLVPREMGRSKEDAREAALRVLKKIEGQ